MDHDTFDINVRGSGFNIATMLVTGFMFGVSISNCVYYARIADRPSEAMGSAAAKAMLGVNIVLAVLSGLIFLWASYKLLIANEDKYDNMTKYVNSARERMNTMKRSTEMSLRELDFADSDNIFDSSNMLSDSDFSEFE